MPYTKYADESTQTVQQGWAAVVIKNFDIFLNTKRMVNFPNGEAFLRPCYANLRIFYNSVRHEFTEEEIVICDKLVGETKKKLEDYEYTVLSNTNQKIRQEPLYLKKKNEIHDSIEESYNKISIYMKMHGIWRYLRIDVVAKAIEDWKN